MNIQELKQMFAENNATFEDVEKIVGDASFSEAAKLGKSYAEGMKYATFEDAPFCIDKVDAAPVKVIVADSVKTLIEDMKNSAKVQSDTREKSADNYEASFCLYGRMKDGKILITDAFWDERGYKPNEHLYADPDALDYGNFFANFSNVTTTSKWFEKKVDDVCLGATADGTLVVIYGHTHPQTSTYGKINNYPSRTDVVLAVEEAVIRYAQQNGTCTFLNAIINADGDLNIFGYDAESEKFLILDDVKYQNGEKIASYTEGNYPISSGPSGFGLS